MMTKEKDIFMKTGEKLPVMEHFYTIQGEGFHSGKAAYFIRIAGCDVGCHWCDVKESWEISQYPLIEADTLARQAAEFCKTVIITGGEPLMWNLDILTGYLKALGCMIHVETSGAYPLSGIIDWITLSPKKTGLPREEVYLKAHELKVIIFNTHDFVFAHQQAEKVSEDCLLYVQSEWGKREKNYPKIAQYILENPQWRASIQTHKYLNIP